MVATARITAAAQTFVYGHFRPRVSANTVQWAIGRCVFPRKKVPFTFGFGLPSNIPFHGRQKSTFQTASRSVHPFLQDARSWPRHTQIKLANSKFFSARQKTLSHGLSYCVVSYVTGSWFIDHFDIFESGTLSNSRPDMSQRALSWQTGVWITSARVHVLYWPLHWTPLLQAACSSCSLSLLRSTTLCLKIVRLFSPPGCWKQARQSICSASVSYLFVCLFIYCFNDSC